MQWKCARDHEWNATLDRIKCQNSWYPYCAGQAKNTLDIAKTVAINKGKFVFQMNILMVHLILRWKCAKGHEWNATLESVKNQDSWCPIYAGCNWTIENMQNLAQKCNGNCLSNSYKDVHPK